MVAFRWICQGTRELAKQLQHQTISPEDITSAAPNSTSCCGRGDTACRRTARRWKGTASRSRRSFPAHRGLGDGVSTRGTTGHSGDTKKKEPLGNMKNPSQTYRKKEEPRRVKTHDFPNKELGKAAPYGVYDIASNEAGVSIGVSMEQSGTSPVLPHYAYVAGSPPGDARYRCHSDWIDNDRHRVARSCLALPTRI